MIKYYKEKETGDFLSVDHATECYYRKTGQPKIREGRAAAIANHLGSISTCGISVDFLENECTEVTRAEVPTEWLKAIKGKR